jgi:hypothetical protein
VDNDRQTGDWAGTEYWLWASYQANGGDPITAPIQQFVQAEVWKYGGGEEGWFDYLSDATIIVDSIANTITLNGYIPGLTPESRVYFHTYDYLGDGDFVANPAIHLVNASSKLSGETLEVTLQMLDLPPELTFRRPNVTMSGGGAQHRPSTSRIEHEYEWGVKIDVDNNPQTGDSYGFEYELITYFRIESGEPFNAPIQRAAKAGIWRCDKKEIPNEYRCAYFLSATFVVDTDLNTITLSGDIPGVTIESPMYFFAYDYFSGENWLE